MKQHRLEEVSRSHELHPHPPVPDDHPRAGRRDQEAPQRPGRRDQGAARPEQRHHSRRENLYVIVRRLDTDGDERAEATWNHRTPVFTTGTALMRYVQTRVPPGCYHLWWYHGWDHRQRYPLGVSTLTIERASPTVRTDEL